MSERPSMDVDIVCVGFGPAMGGFLTTLAPALAELPSPPQVVCYERADGLGFGVSGVATRARGIRQSFPNLDPAQIPMAAPVGEEKIVYLLDPIGASRRPASLRLADRFTRRLANRELQAIELPGSPEFLHKTGGLVLSIGQFNQFVGEQLMMSGAVQLWPGVPVAEPLIEDRRVVGVRLAEQNGQPGMDIRAALTVIGDGPFGPVGRRIDETFGVPGGFERNEWAVGAKMVIDLPEGVALEPGTVFHTIGYPEPEIFGFLYVHPERMVSAGIFVPSWFANPVRTSYRYLQHFIQHPYLWRYLKGGRLRSWGAKSLLESGRRGEPWLVGDGYARIGEGSGSTNMLTGSGVDEAWTTGIQLAQGVIELLGERAPFTSENLERTYVARRRESWVEREGRIAENARDGFQSGFLKGMIGMGLAGITKGWFTIHQEPRPAAETLSSIEAYFSDRVPLKEIETIREQCRATGAPLHDVLMERSGWPPIPYDGQLLVTHQDALLVGGKVQATPGFADHVEFLRRELCETCLTQVCVEMCSGEAITRKEGGAPVFDREKCVHCGACLWNCSRAVDGRTNIEFRAGAGGLHSAEN
ncbi:MAG: 4Fe-4S ferredoxin [Acidobacteriia bacterium]|nr:4Fe-4S ferredoxin [Terriglobia bacterium]